MDERIIAIAIAAAGLAAIALTAFVLNRRKKRLPVEPDDFYVIGTVDDLEERVYVKYRILWWEHDGSRYTSDATSRDYGAGMIAIATHAPKDHQLRIHRVPNVGSDVRAAIDVLCRVKDVWHIVDRRPLRGEQQGYDLAHALIQRVPVPAMCVDDRGVVILTRSLDDIVDEVLTNH